MQLLTTVPVLLVNIDYAVIDNCASTPCQNGATCVNSINQYKCNCADGYEGNNCEKGG